MVHQLKAAALSSFLATGLAQPSFNCNPCINRADHVVKAIVQGTKSDPFWRQIEAAMRQSEKDMRISLDMELYDTLDTEQMAADIRAAISSKNPPDALVVTIPSYYVKAAVSEAIESGLPVFGMHSGYEYYEELGMQGFVAMDQKEAGIAAGNTFLKIADTTGSTTKAAYITPVISEIVFDEERLMGLTSVIDNVDQIEKSTMITQFEGCPYDVVLLANSALFDYAVTAYQENGCDFATKPIAIFDTAGNENNIHEGLSSGKLAFTVSSEQYHQGAFSIMAASQFLTTGKAIASSSESTFGMQTVGPVITTRTHPLSDSMHQCKSEAYPICVDVVAIEKTKGTACECTDRESTKIAGVVHAVTTDPFWDVVFSSAQQAADDFGVELVLDRLEPNDDSNILFEKMAGQIESLCKQGVDGIFVTIPNDIVLDEIELCVKLNVPVVAINAGHESSQNLDLYHFIGMIDWNAGYEAGRRMAATGQVDKALCLIHATNNVFATDRCSGFEAGINETNPSIEYLGEVDVPPDNLVQHKQIMEDHIKEKTGDSGDWDGIGILLSGASQIVPGLNLKDDHPKVLLGAFDTNEQLYSALDEGKIMFGIDQAPYLQGYLPVALLSLQSQTGQQLSNHFIESGPTFITESPSAEESTCQASRFPVCAGPDSVSAAEPEVVVKEYKGGIYAVSVIIVSCAMTVAFLTYRVHHVNKFVKRARKEGQDVPKLTAGSYAAGIYQSPQEVVRRMSSVQSLA